MPWFRFIGDAQVIIPFRDEKCLLNFANLGGENGWAWVAHRPNDYDNKVVLIRRPNIMALNHDLTQYGFEVPAGSPAERIMCAAVRCGYAEDLPDDERWRREILGSRDALKRIGVSFVKARDQAQNHRPTGHPW